MEFCLIHYIKYMVQIITILLFLNLCVLIIVFYIDSDKVGLSELALAQEHDDFIIKLNTI